MQADSTTHLPAEMRVLDHELGRWFLLKVGSTYIFDTLVDSGHAQMGLRFELDPSETNAFEAHGRDALHRLSEHVLRNVRDFFPRDEAARHHADSIQVAIQTWRSARNT